ncbi:UNVERIFIED_CONTAM: Eukaryotic translation initiation factor 2 subunit beta [Sesamum radiatum]|uniref:Eukaryotic translation initiation factor 2 subunit beta n=1 Tax=Sesamum radiatum TaxID=300843 RepID=A0AAW2R6L9_SESRA
MAHQESSKDVDVPDIAPFDPTKKKNKNKVVVQDPPPPPAVADDPAHNIITHNTQTISTSDQGVETAFVGLKKKKKKPLESDTPNDQNADNLDGLDGNKEDGESNLHPKYPWEGSDRDYEYEELLGRVFNILRENNPELAGDRRRTVMRPPQVLREGTKKTVFVNFMDLCKTSVSLRLVVKGRFAPKNFEGILRRYVNEYVICNGCKSPDTLLTKENRLFFLRCEQCGSGRSVAPIKAGFVARIGRRKPGT